MKLKKFKDFVKNIERNPRINSGKRFTVEGQDITLLATNLVDFFKENGIDFGEDLPSINFSRGKQPGSKVSPMFKETGRYTPFDNQIVIFTEKRALKDCLRSLAHELIHADQKINKGMEVDIASTGITNGNKEGEKIESEAYERGNILFRKWEETMRNSF